MIRNKLKWISALAFLGLVNAADADLVLTLTDAGAAGVTGTFSGGSGTSDATGDQVIIFDTLDSFTNDSVERTSVGAPSGGLMWGGASLALPDGVHGFGDGDPGGSGTFQSFLFLSFDSFIPISTPLSVLNGQSFTIPGWLYSDLNPGTYNDVSFSPGGPIGTGHDFTLIVGAAAAVPEPSSLMFGLLPLVALTLRRRRQ